MFLSEVLISILIFVLSIQYFIHSIFCNQVLYLFLMYVLMKKRKGSMNALEARFDTKRI